MFVVAPPMLCWGFEKLVRTSCSGIELSGTARTLDEALAVDGRAGVDMMVVDIDEAHTEQALRDAAQRFPVMLLTSREPGAVEQEMKEIGVYAVLRTGDSPSALISAIQQGVAAADRRPHGLHGSRRAPIATAPAREADDRARIESLTVRERQLVLAVLCNATAPGKVIASRLCISEHTLRNHLTSIYGKLGVRNRLSLHAYAAQHRLDGQAGLTGQPH
ncbi:helix-turn-helix transcriptional regulator [Ramlibacter sp.]|uniref:helix-turn-helix transcriptional regulator n=1 Tax=Ramlibacter sp. TaxID=1917967 RepID=UPI002D267EDA|nr:LuxR C-terminal-related transcriptional regulator [Ramlibacter sp.]HYD75993.1 LuxR C-terminal-related transcriptional regulator [Ramlibacter sp.]